MSVKEVRLEMISLQEKSQIIGLHIKGKSNRRIAKELGLSRDTVNKYVAEHDELQAELLAADPEDGEAVRDATERIVAEPKYDASKRRARKWTPAMDQRLDEILAAEARKRKALGWDKQMMTRRQIHAQLRAEGFDIGLTTVQNEVREKLGGKKEACIAQEYAYGDRFEYDFGEVHLVIAGTMRKLYMAVMAMPASGGRFALLYESQGKDVFEDSQCASSSVSAGASARASTTTCATWSSASSARTRRRSTRTCSSSRPATGSPSTSRTAIRGTRRAPSNRP